MKGRDQDLQDRAFLNAVTWHLEAGEKLWRVCFVARATITHEWEAWKLARECHRDVDVVYRWAQAATAWAGLWHYFRFVEPQPLVRDRLRELRHRLPYSHFATAGDLMRRHDLSPLGVFAMLDEAEKNGAGVRRMAAYTGGEEGNGEGGGYENGSGEDGLVLSVRRWDATYLEHLLAQQGSDKKLLMHVVLLPPEWQDVQQVKVNRA